MATLRVAASLLLLVSFGRAFTAHQVKLQPLTSCDKRFVTSNTPFGTKRRRRAPASFRQEVSIPLLYSQTNDEEGNNDTRPPRVLSLGMLAFPVASLIFPALLQLARSVPPNSTEQVAVITALFISNQAYLYLMAATIVGLAATRGANDSPQLGRRIIALTEELLYRPPLEKSSNTTSVEEYTKPSMIQSLADSGFEESLDEVSSETQAILLPLLVSFLLALSVFLLPFWSGTPSIGDGTAGWEVQNFVSKILPSTSKIWNVGLLALFTRAEIRRLAFELKVSTSAIVEWGIAVAITGLACLAKLWTAQNFLNMALAVLVARAIQLDQFVAVVGALSLLTLYDATSVFLIPAAGASDALMASSSSDSLFTSTVDLAASQTAAGSAMGSVAIQKLTSGDFQPGLLVTKVGKSLGGTLGLGDAVFPSLLANFVKRFDDTKANEDGRMSLFPVSIAGYLIGCLACEFTPLISLSGIPALVFIIPLMLTSVLVVAASTGEMRKLSAFKPRDE
eukprot:scaffold6749_cov162-Amphora_coffeaeformis.AAC.1